MSELMTIWPMMLVKTLRETRLAVGRLWWILGYGRVRPTADQQSSFATWSRTMRRGELPGLTGNSNRDDNKQIDVKESKD